MFKVRDSSRGGRWGSVQAGILRRPSPRHTEDRVCLCAMSYSLMQGKRLGVGGQGERGMALPPDAVSRAHCMPSSRGALSCEVG